MFCEFVLQEKNGLDFCHEKFDYYFSGSDSRRVKNVIIFLFNLKVKLTDTVDVYRLRYGAPCWLLKQKGF